LFAQGLTDLHRDYDIVARLGGDEFVIAVVGLDDEVIRKKSGRDYSTRYQCR
ncbi:MAG: diguanylate cyclase, partial [Acidobacteriaceae bacterium]|nr:diguanylate cyclase [Acidobacteriaceae bacterium]